MEAIIVLPVFLLLTTIVIQIFLLTIAQVQLRYATFCAARVGAVRNADIDEMNNTVGKILSKTQGYIPIFSGSYTVERLTPPNKRNQEVRNNPEPVSSLLKIRVHWDFPLSIPLINLLFSKIPGCRFYNNIPTVPLQATWTTVLFEGTME